MHGVVKLRLSRHHLPVHSTREREENILRRAKGKRASITVYTLTNILESIFGTSNVSHLDADVDEVREPWEVL